MCRPHPQGLLIDRRPILLVRLPPAPVTDCDGKCVPPGTGSVKASPQWATSSGSRTAHPVPDLRGIFHCIDFGVASARSTSRLALRSASWGALAGKDRDARRRATATC